MATRGAARINLIADATGVRRGTREAERDISRLSRAGTASFSALKTGALAAGAAIGTTLAVGVRTGWQELQEAEAASARLNTVLAATKGAAGLTRAELDRMNDTLQRNSTLEGDVIQGAQAMLLTYTNIGEKTFPRATQAAIDWARVMKVDAESAAKLVGRALQDPEKGLARLERAGVSFTAAERKRIEAMQDAGRETEAQNLILQKLEGRVKGAEQAYSQTLPGAIDKAKRAWKDLTEDAVRRVVEEWPRIQEVIGRVVDWLRVNVVPDVRAAVEAITGFWRDHETDIRKFVGLIARNLKRLWDQVADIVRLIVNLLEGDFGEAWEAAKRIVRRAVEGIIDLIRTIGPLALRALRTLGGNLLRGLGDALRNLPRVLGETIKAVFNALPGLVRDAVTSSATQIGRTFTSSIQNSVPDFASPFDPVGRAKGGFIPGQYRGRDDQVALVASGEAILTPRQQAMVPGGRATLTRIFQATGGVIGGRGFAAGGWVNPVPGGSWRYGPGGGTHSRSENGYVWQDDDAWDIMGADGTPVYAANSGRVSATRPFSSDPRYWGHGLYLDVAGGQFFYKHLKTLAVRAGQRVTAGQLLGTLGAGVNGGPHLHLGARPIGLLDQARRGGRPGATGGTSGAPDEGDGVSGRDTPPGLTVQQFRRALRGLNASPSSPRGLTDIPSIDARHADDPLQERQILAAGKGRSEVIRTQIAEYRQDADDITKRMKQLVGRRNTLTKMIRRLRAEGARRGTSRARRERILDQLRDLYDQRRDVQDALRTLAGERDEVLRQASILGYDLTDAVREEAETEKAEFEQANPPTDAAASDAGVGQLTPEQERTIRRGQVAANENVILSEFLATAFGPGDIGQGGRGAVGAATGGRWVPIHVDAGSLSAAVGSSIGTGGYVTAGLVPSGA